MSLKPNTTQRWTRATLAALAVLSVVFLYWLMSASTPRRPAPVASPINAGAAPAELSAADAAAVCLATYYPSHNSASAQTLTNESRLKIVANPAGAGFVAEPDGLARIEREALERLARPGWHPIHPDKYVRAIFPERYADAIAVASQTHTIRAKPLGADAASAARIAADGSLVYASAFPGCDVVYRASALKTEEFLVLRDAHAQAAWSWDLDCGPLTPRLTPMKSIELVDAQGIPRQRINAPEGKDAAGVRLSVGERLTVTLDGTRITVAADVKGLTFPVVIDPTWSSTGASAFPRWRYTATLLENGKVLIVGGQIVPQLSINSYSLAACELYDPLLKTWSATTLLPVSRHFHTAVRLNNGNVLVAGGLNYTSPNTPVDTSSLLYNPASETWTSVRSLNSSHAFGHSLNKLQDGRILLAGGTNSTSSLTTDCEILDSTASGPWTTINPLLANHSGHLAVMLQSGAILLTCGQPGNNLDCEQYNPITNQWVMTSAMQFTNVSGNSGNSPGVILSGNYVLMPGGDSGKNKSQLFDAGSGNWSLTGNLTTPRTELLIAALSNTTALVIGGVDSSGTKFSSCEYFDLASKTFRTAPSLNNPRADGIVTNLLDGTVLITGNVPELTTGNDQSPGTCEIFDPKPTATSQTISTHSGTGLNVTLSGQTISTSNSYNVIQQPNHGVLSGTAPNLTYTPSAGYVGSDSFTFKVNDGALDSNVATVSINVTNTSPTVIASASPTLLVEGQSVSFNANGNDADGDPFTYSWNFGDGSPLTAQQNPAHAYSTAGSYTAVVTVTDSLGATGTSSVVIQVVSLANGPMARFTTSDVVAFVGLPITFDASFSTDPANNIAQYQWNFGDGTPNGGGQVISKIYTTAGPVTATLTVTDGTGLTNSVSRVIQVLPANEIGLFNSQINYNVKWDRNLTNADTLTLSAVLNVGDAVVGAGAVVAFEVAGQRYTGTLDGKLRDFSNSNEKWQVGANLRGKPFGEVTLKLTLKHASLGLGFNQAGVVATADLHDIITQDIPIHIEIAGRAFDVPISTDFKFRKNGTAASGSGSGPN